MQKVITVSQAARLTSLTEATVRRLADAGVIPIAQRIEKSGERLLDAAGTIDFALRRVLAGYKADTGKPTDAQIVAKLASVLRRADGQRLAAVIGVSIAAAEKFSPAARQALAAAVSDALLRTPTDGDAAAGHIVKLIHGR